MKTVSLRTCGLYLGHLQLRGAPASASACSFTLPTLPHPHFHLRFI